jgi:hypothetical protein
MNLLQNFIEVIFHEFKFVQVLFSICATNSRPTATRRPTEVKTRQVVGTWEGGQLECFHDKTLTVARRACGSCNHRMGLVFEHSWGNSAAKLAPIGTKPPVREPRQSRGGYLWFFYALPIPQCKQKAQGFSE